VSKRTRGITWTLFNYEPYLDKMKRYAQDECEYMIFGFEVCPTTGKKHLQGYHYYSNARTYPNKKFRDLFDNTISDFFSNGSPKQNYDYCSKIGEFWEHGKLPTQGARTDWEQVRSHIQEGGDISTAVEQQPQLLPCIRSLERFQQISLRPLNRTVKVILLTGAPGTGKSRWAHETYPDLYSKPDGNWFDGYTGQKTLLLDDFYGDLAYPQLLKVCDRYPLNLPVKGGFIYAQYDTVIITSNRAPQHWYPAHDVTALKRRITETKHLDITNAPPEVLQEEEDVQEARVPTTQDI